MGQEVVSSQTHGAHRKLVVFKLQSSTYIAFRDVTEFALKLLTASWKRPLRSMFLIAARQRPEET